MVSRGSTPGPPCSPSLLYFQISPCQLNKAGLDGLLHLSFEQVSYLYILTRTPQKEVSTILMTTPAEQILQSKFNLRDTHKLSDYFFLQLVCSYEEPRLQTKPKCNYTFITYFSTDYQIYQMGKGRDLGNLHAHKAKMNRPNIKPIHLSIFQNNQHKLCLAPFHVTEKKNGNEKDSPN